MNSALIVFLIYTLAVFGLAALSNQLLKSKGFLSEYFLGSRSLGVWAFALTFAATSASGGSFTGFPSKIYTYGWVLALWIASYMVVPICTMGWLGKRLNQVARISGAITIPDVIRDRYQSRSLGLLSVLLILFFMIFNLVAQFKAGSYILMVLLDDIEVFHTAAEGFVSWSGITSTLGPEYIFCLLVFGVAVIFYTTYGGFHAVVWTDVMQGVVMVIGVMVMLPLAISQVGGLSNATKDMAQMTPPRTGVLAVNMLEPASEALSLKRGQWFMAEAEGEDFPAVYRLKESVKVEEGTAAAVATDPGRSHEDNEILVLKITSPHEVERIVKEAEEDNDYLKIQSTAFKPTDFQKEDPTTGEMVDFYPRDEEGAPKRGMYVSAPGADPGSEIGFLPFSLAISFFCFWAMCGTGQPSNMVRLMAFNNSLTLKKSIAAVALYFSFIYFPLVIIFCCARVLMPGMEVASDSIMPKMTILLTENAGVPWLAGLLVAAPFAAVMSTVDSFLLMMSSAIVRDIYQRNINPNASENTVKWMSYACTLVIGGGAMFFAINPPDFLQDIIVYTGSGLAACFLAPVVYSLYWPRCNKEAIFGGMFAGFIAHTSMYVWGIFENGSFYKPYKLLDFDPAVVGLSASFLAVYFVGKMFPAPEESIIKKYFGKKDSSAS